MTFWDALGSSRAAIGLAKTLAFGDVPHAWLLLGPSGSGKRPIAVAMAAALQCIEEPGVGCGRCSSCLRILRHRHPDVHHVVPEGPLIPVDVIRESVIPEAARSPFEARYKIFIIEEADRMNVQAQNALLKTLEEPQPDTVFVLVSEHEDDVLETVRSRCVVIRLEPLASERIVEMLRREGASKEGAELAARLSGGDFERARALAFDDDVAARRKRWMDIPRRVTSPPDILDLAAEVIDAARSAVKDREVEQKHEIEELAEAMGEGRGTAAVRQSLAKRHKRELRRLEQSIIAEMLTSLASFYRDVLVMRSAGAEAIANEDAADELETWAASEARDVHLLRAAERCSEALADLPLNANPPLLVEAVLLDVARLVPPPVRVHA